MALWRRLTASLLAAAALALMSLLVYRVAVEQLLPKGVCNVQWIGVAYLVLWWLAALLGALGLWVSAWWPTNSRAQWWPWAAAAVCLGFVVPGLPDLGTLFFLIGFAFALAAYIVQPPADAQRGLRYTLLGAGAITILVLLIGWLVLERVSWVPC